MHSEFIARVPGQIVGNVAASLGVGLGMHLEIPCRQFVKRRAAGLGYTLFTIGYRDWVDSNVTSHSPHAYFQANWGRVYYRFQYDFTLYYSGGKKQGINPPVYLTFANNSEARLRMHSFSQTISILEPYGLKSDIDLAYQIKDYLDGITSNSSRYAAGITQSYRIPNTRIHPRIGYRTVYEKSGDDPSTYSYHELTAGVASAIYWGIWADISFAYLWTNYPDFSSSNARQDSTYTTALSLRRHIFKRLLISFSYTHINNDSNFILDGNDTYSFKKNVYSLEFTYRF